MPSYVARLTGPAVRPNPARATTLGVEFDSLLAASLPVSTDFREDQIAPLAFSAWYQLISQWLRRWADHVILKRDSRDAHADLSHTERARFGARDGHSL